HAGRCPSPPSTPYGVSLLQVEAVAAGLGRRHGVSITPLRYAPVVGSHVPSPLGRLLRLPVVPASGHSGAAVRRARVAAGSPPPFQLLPPEDACVAMVRAMLVEHDGPLNIVGSDAASPWEGVRLGRRVPPPGASR